MGSNRPDSFTENSFKHSDGVRFTEKQKQVLKESKNIIKKVKTCAYSGLPSMEHYMTETK